MFTTPRLSGGSGARTVSQSGQSDDAACRQEFDVAMILGSLDTSIGALQRQQGMVEEVIKRRPSSTLASQMKSLICGPDHTHEKLQTTLVWLRKKERELRVQKLVYIQQLLQEQEGGKPVCFIDSGGGQGASRLPPRLDQGQSAGPSERDGARRQASGRLHHPDSTALQSQQGRFPSAGSSYFSSPKARSVAAAANAIADASHHASLALAAEPPTAFSTNRPAETPATGSDEAGSTGNGHAHRRFFFGGSVNGRPDRGGMQGRSQRGADSSSLSLVPAPEYSLADGLDLYRSGPDGAGRFPDFVAAFLPSASGAILEAGYGAQGTDEDPGYNATHVQRSKSSRARSWKSLLPRFDGGCCNATYGFDDGTGTNDDDGGGTSGPRAAKKTGGGEEPFLQRSHGPQVMRGSNQRASSSSDLVGKWSDGESWRSGSSGADDDVSLRRSNSARVSAGSAGEGSARMWASGARSRVGRSRRRRSLEIQEFEALSAPPVTLAIAGPASGSGSTEITTSRRGYVARAPASPDADAGAGGGVGRDFVDGRPRRGRRTSFPTNSLAIVRTEHHSKKTFATSKASQPRQRRRRSTGALPTIGFEDQRAFDQTTEEAPALCPCSPGSSVADSSIASWTVQGTGASALYSRSSWSKYVDAERKVATALAGQRARTAGANIRTASSALDVAAAAATAASDWQARGGVTRGPERSAASAFRARHAPSSMRASNISSSEDDARGSRWARATAAALWRGSGSFMSSKASVGGSSFDESGAPRSTLHAAVVVVSSTSLGHREETLGAERAASPVGGDDNQTDKADKADVMRIDIQEGTEPECTNAGTAARVTTPAAVKAALVAVLGEPARASTNGSATGWSEEPESANEPVTVAAAASPGRGRNAKRILRRAASVASCLSPSVVRKTLRSSSRNGRHTPFDQQQSHQHVAPRLAAPVGPRPRRKSATAAMTAYRDTPREGPTPAAAAAAAAATAAAAADAAVAAAADAAAAADGAPASVDAIFGEDGSPPSPPPSLGQNWQQRSQELYKENPASPPAPTRSRKKMSARRGRGRPPCYENETTPRRNRLQHDDDQQQQQQWQ